MIKPTTALRRISGLKKRIWGIQGGQGAGKTFSICILIINHASSNPDKEIYIASAELSKMRDTVIKDFINILNIIGLDVKKTGISHGSPRVDFPNGSFVRFIGLDKEDVGKGLRSDLMFVNEANKVNFETYRELTSRAKRIIVDFNPNKKFWFHTEVQPKKDCDFLVLTFRDNEFLSKEERNTVLEYKTKGYDKDGNIINEYWANKWRIYGLGEIGGVEGRIFFWKPISYYEYESLNVQEYYGCDWGKSDPFAIGKCKYYDNKLYVHELNYKSENEWFKSLPQSVITQIRAKQGDGFVTWLFTKLGIPKDKLVVCDNNRKTKLATLRNNGWESAVETSKPKGSVLDGIDLLHNLEVYYTTESPNIEHEQEVYCWAKDKFDQELEEPIDANNHHIDWIRYVALYLQKYGVIRRS